MTGKGKLALNPFIYVPTLFGGAALDLIVAYGFTGDIDALVSLSSLSLGSSSFSWVGAWIMTRYDLGSVEVLSYNILALQLG